MKFLKYLAAIAMATTLVACGGGGGGSTTGSDGGGVKDPVAADFIFELDKTTIFNGGTDKAAIKITALDSERNIVSGVPVTVSVDSGVFTPDSGTVTNAQGQFSGSVSIGGNKNNRLISATIKVSGIAKKASIVVAGSKISATPVPATPVAGELVTLNISTTDSADSPIQYASLNLSGTAGASGAIQTDASGNKVSTFKAPTVPGEYNVVVVGLGVTTTKVITVLDSSGGGKPAVDPSVAISASSLTPLPTSILANMAGSTTSRSKLSAKFLTTGNTPIENMRVRFEVVPPVLGSGEAISTNTATVYTDGSGVAEADYIAGTRTSPTNGVTVRACYKKTDFIDANDCPAWVTANLTVAGTPLSISITDDNQMKKGLGDIAYEKKFLIQVNDAAGVAVEGAVISASVDITHYGKGVFDGFYPYGSIAPTVLNGSLARNPLDITKIIDGSTVAPFSAVVSGSVRDFNVWCVNEDTNRNGFLDSNEDKNGDSILQPRKAEIIVSYVNGNKTDAKGQMLVQISYGQNMGKWLAYTLRATTGVAGSEGDASKSYITNVLEDDIENGSFWTPPFGRNACNKAN